MNNICFELSLSLGVGLRHYVNKAGQTPPSTTVASRYSFLRELQGEVLENVSRLLRQSSRKAHLRFKLPLCYSKFSLYRALRPTLTRPEELRIDLLRPYQIFQLFQTRKYPVFKDLCRHVNPLEQIIELFCSASRVPSASELGQMLANLLEGYAVTSIVLAWSSKTYMTPRKHLANYLRYLAHAIVVRSIANIEYFIVNRFGGSLQHRDNRMRDVQAMDQWPPRCPVAGHLDLVGRPC